MSEVLLGDLDLLKLDRLDALVIAVLLDGLDVLKLDWLDEVVLLCVFFVRGGECTIGNRRTARLLLSKTLL